MNGLYAHQQQSSPYNIHINMQHNNFNYFQPSISYAYLYDVCVCHQAESQQFCFQDFLPVFNSPYLTFFMEGCLSKWCRINLADVCEED